MSSNEQRAADFNELYEGRRTGEMASEHLARLDRIMDAAEKRGAEQVARRMRELATEWATTQAAWVHRDRVVARLRALADEVAPPEPS